MQNNLSRRDFLSLLGTSAATVTLTGCLPGMSRSAKAARPNVIVLYIDDLGYGDVEPFGCPDIPTPHINRLAASGTKCMNGYVTAPICSPSRASLMAGIYPQRFGMNGLTNRGKALPPEHPTMAEYMRKRGYVTGMVGRWDMGDKTQGPLDTGFVEMARRPGPAPGAKTPTYIGYDDSYWTEIQGPEMAEFVDRHKDEPFFLYFAPLAVHSPVTDVPQRYLDRVPEAVTGKRRYLAGTLIAADDAIGILLDKLEAEGLYEDTLIFLIGDNGGSISDQARNLPWRGYKGGPFEGGVHVPYIVSWPRVIPANASFDGLVSALDVYPTCAAAAGGQPPERLDGVDLLPYLTGRRKGDPHEFLYWRFLETMVWANSFNWRFMDKIKNKDKTPWLKQGRAVRHGKWRWLRYQDNLDFAVMHEELIDLENDPGAEINLIEEKPEIAKFLRNKYEQWEAALPEPEPYVSHSAQGQCPGGRGWVIKDGSEK